MTNIEIIKPSTSTKDSISINHYSTVASVVNTIADGLNVFGVLNLPDEVMGPSRKTIIPGRVNIGNCIARGKMVIGQKYQVPYNNQIYHGVMPNKEISPEVFECLVDYIEHK